MQVDQKWERGLIPCPQALPGSRLRQDDPIRIGGITPLTTIDFPDRLAAVFFCQGCAWRCRYCHNAHLQPFAPLTEHGDEMRWSHALLFLDARKGFLDGVVFSGGEPTLQPDLPEAMRQVKARGFAVGLHTAGPDPDRLATVLPLVDWVGMDIKAPLDERYDRIVGVKGRAASVRESLICLIQSGVEYQLRTTVHPSLLSPLDLDDLRSELAALGAPATVIQPFRPEGCADKTLAPTPPPTICNSSLRSR